MMAAFVGYLLRAQSIGIQSNFVLHHENSDPDNEDALPNFKYDHEEVGLSLRSM